MGLSPKLNVVKLNNMVEVVVGTLSALSGTPTQSAYAAVPDLAV